MYMYMCSHLCTCTHVPHPHVSPNPMCTHPYVYPTPLCPHPTFPLSTQEPLLPLEECQGACIEAQHVKEDAIHSLPPPVCNICRGGHQLYVLQVDYALPPVHKGEELLRIQVVTGAGQTK